MVRHIIYDWLSLSTGQREIRICLSNYNNDVILSYCREEDGKISKRVFDLVINENRTEVYKNDMENISNERRL